MKDIPAGVAGDRTDPASHSPGVCLPRPEFLRSRQKSPASSEGNSSKRQEFHPPHFPALLQEAQAAQTLPAIPKRSPAPALLPCSCEQRPRSPCEAQEASDPRCCSRGWRHILTGRDLRHNSGTAWLCRPARKSQGVFETGVS